MNKLFKFALAALPMLMLASCAKDDLGLENDIAQESETRYLRVTLSSPTASPVSRAWPNDGNGNVSTTPVVGNEGYYADGTEAENKIRTLEFYFYDRNKQFHSYVPMTIDNPPATPTENPRPDDVTQDDGTVLPGRPNIAAFYHCNVPIQLTQGQALPNYVICIVNSVEGTAYQGSTMQDAQAKILSRLYGAEDDAPEGVQGTDYFGMSNSVYYGEDPVTGKTGELILAAPFTTEKLLTITEVEKLEKQAEDTGAANQNEIEKYTINIPVERYAVKVKMDLSNLATSTNMPDYSAANSGGVQTTTDPADGKVTTTYTPITLKFIPKKWGTNATERTFYFLKSFREPQTDAQGNGTGKPSDIFATQNQLNDLLFDGWNNEAHKRCFWARTPGYYSDKYPLTGDDIADHMLRDELGNLTYPKDDKENPIYPYDLWYKSWNECAEVGTLTDERAEYVKETTMNYTRLTGAGMGDQYLPTASLPAVILLGQYQVGNASLGTDFYLYGKASGGTPIVYSNYATEKIEGTQDIRAKMFVDQTIVLKKDGAQYVPISNESALDANGKESFILEHPKKEVREYASKVEAANTTASILHVASDIVVLQLKQAPTTTLYFFNPYAGEYQPITSDNLTHVNHLLLQNLGGAHFYKDGMAYFSAPIQHWGWYREGNTNRYVTEKNEETGEVTTTDKIMPWTDWVWKDMKTGDFGVVRNHVYTIKIGSIKGLGTAISNPTEPIVPPADKVNYAVHFHVNIQRWAVLPTQEWNW